MDPVCGHGDVLGAEPTTRVHATDQLDRHPVHEPVHRGPAATRLRQYLASRRRKLPVPLRWALGLGILLTLAYGLILLVLFAGDRAVFRQMVTLLLLTPVSGREAAMLVVYRGADPAPVAWVAATSIVNDLGLLLITVPLLWYALERLRDSPRVGGVVVRLEKAAFDHRRFLDRWGLLGLLLLAWAPAYGGGIPTATVLGVLLRVPTVRLMVVLGIGVIGIIGFWAVALRSASDILPSEGPWTYAPLLVVLALSGVTAVSVVRRRRFRPILKLEKSGWLAPDHLARLRSVGITDAAQLLHVDCDILSQRLGLPRGPLLRCRLISGLLLLPSMTPRQAEMLNAVGIGTILDLALAPPQLVLDALGELEAGHAARRRTEARSLRALALRWHTDAARFVALASGGEHDAPWESVRPAAVLP